MTAYVVQVVRARPESRVSAGARVGEFETEEEARYFARVAPHARSLRGCELAIRKVGARTGPAHLPAAA
jgi:hypothetical protein